MGQPQRRGDSLRVAHEHIGRIGGRLVGRAALPMRAQVGHDRLETGLRQLLGMAELDPVDLRAREQAVQQEYRRALAQSLHSQAGAIETGHEL